MRGTRRLHHLNPKLTDLMVTNASFRDALEIESVESIS